jgi:hypothetical protein
MALPPPRPLILELESRAPKEMETIFADDSSLFFTRVDGRDQRGLFEHLLKKLILA